MPRVYISLIVVALFLAGCTSETSRSVRAAMATLVGKRATLISNAVAVNHDGDRLLQPLTAPGLHSYRERNRVIGEYPAGATLVFRGVTATTHKYGRYHFLLADVMDGERILERGLLVSEPWLLPNAALFTVRPE